MYEINEMLLIYSALFLSAEYLLTNVSDIKMVAFWDVMPCGFVNGYQNYRGTCYPYLWELQTEEWDSKFHQNYGTHLSNYMVFHPRRS